MDRGGLNHRFLSPSYAIIAQQTDFSSCHIVYNIVLCNGSHAWCVVRDGISYQIIEFTLTGLGLMSGPRRLLIGRSGFGIHFLTKSNLGTAHFPDRTVPSLTGCS